MSHVHLSSRSEQPTPNCVLALAGWASTGSVGRVEDFGIMQQLAKPDGVSPFALLGPLHLFVSYANEGWGICGSFSGPH